ncbi:hypothetical protein K466DRAFT_502176 [Polyporus arcularius HHB13444]|uniref:DUF6589 domain-containing protein n=1 Tax=Polyporus arcularius HHB13444 TaxID=1314778 RepID=A0A5C3P6H3_9APHY|nr:hypothetical protein K466DRAFT_502176 [Polyporus arcularius HHB13444]
MAVICMCVFACNRATNILALPLGLFLKISGTSERVLQLLSNMGLTVSSSTVERLKECMSEDAVQLAIQLITGPSLFFIIFDNINIYLRKFQERVSNRNSMIHATNVAVIGISEGDKEKVEDLDAFLAKRGDRIRATFADVRPTKEDGEHMRQAFECIIAEFLGHYAPGSKSWSRRTEMLEKITKSMPRNRPLEPEVSDTRPTGVFNVNEGSKKGIIQVIDQLQSKSMLTEEEWSSKVRMMQGDWLTSNNLRTARRERKDNVSVMTRMENVVQLSALWHFALNATHMIVRTHFRNAISDPASLSAHKGLLRRTWDANKPNYAAAKALICHSLIARLLRCVMIVDKFTQVDRARTAQKAGDDWLAHEIYFMRDALLFFVFEDAVSMADAGVMLRVLKFWALSFRGASQHNYARECVEILLQWKYELPDALRKALERSWFVNRWGRPGRWIAADLYLEQCNFWVKVSNRKQHARRLPDRTGTARLHCVWKRCHYRIYHEEGVSMCRSLSRHQPSHG